MFKDSLSNFKQVIREENGLSGSANLEKEKEGGWEIKATIEDLASPVWDPIKKLFS